MEKKYIDGLVSVIMPAYNAEKNIVNAIDSVLAQTYSNWELIVVNDCSTDNTLKIVEEKYSKEDRIKIYTLSKNSGVASARNYGFSKAQGRYLAFLDSDDMWLSKKLEMQLQEAQKYNWHFITSGYQIMDDEGKNTKKVYIPPQEITYEMQLRGSRIGCLTVVIDRYIVGSIQMPDMGHEDYITWTDIIKQFGPAYSIQKPLAVYRESLNSLSSNKIKAAKWQWKIYREYYNFNIIKSIRLFIMYAWLGVKKRI